MTKLTMLPASLHVTRPWKNGSGVTTEVLLTPPGAGQADFDLRISTAPITEDGPFSAFPGVERIITVIHGQGLDLDFGGTVERLARFAPFRFDSGLQPVGRPVGSGVRVVNVMARRALWQLTSGEVTCGLDSALEAGEMAVFFAVTGDWQINDSQTIRPEDAALAEGSGRLHLKAAEGAHGVLVRLRPRLA